MDKLKLAPTDIFTGRNTQVIEEVPALGFMRHGPFVLDVCAYQTLWAKRHLDQGTAMGSLAASITHARAVELFGSGLKSSANIATAVVS